MATGVAGFSIEDRVFEGSDFMTRSWRWSVSARRGRAIDRSGQDVTLVARTEGLLIDPRASERGDRQAGGVCRGRRRLPLCAGVRKPADIAAMVRAVAPLPVNVLVMQPGVSVSDSPIWGFAASVLAARWPA